MKFHVVFPFRRCFKPRWILVNSLITFLIVLVVCMFRYTVVCSSWQVVRAVHILCDLHKQGSVAGNMCEDLCSTKVLRPGKCQTLHLAKDVVFEAWWRKQRIIIKSTHLDINKYDSVGTFLNGRKHYPSVAEFTDMLQTTIRFNFNLSLGPQSKGLAILNRLWSLDFMKYIQASPIALHAAMDSMWSLVQQNEYLLMKFFEKNIFPKILGTCGHFYAMEYAEPIVDTGMSVIPIPKMFKKTNIKDDWLTRVSRGIEVLNLIDKMEKSFHQPIHLCDVKPDHFGLSDQYEIKIIDVDTAYFKSIIDKMAATGLNCSRNADCAFWDCKSKCHPVTKTCKSGITNNNLQIICEKLFLGKPGEDEVFDHEYTGLLYPSSSQNQNILRNILEECANPSSGIDSDTRSQASDVILHRLRLLLMEELRN